jgi:hypothetical protein
MVAQHQQRVTPTSVNESQDALIPPDDIAWLWHCHRLAPRRYEEYCHQRFGKLVEAENPFVCQLPDGLDESLDEKNRKGCEITRRRWSDLYAQEPFDSKPVREDQNIEEMKRSDPDEYQHRRLLNGFDLVESCSRQSTFLWQVSGDRFQDSIFLSQGVENYSKFLQLKASSKGRTIIIVPTYQIDLMWHTHILCSISKYNEDCLKIMGCTLHHDDSLNDRTEGGTLDVSFRATKALWHEMHGEEYVVHGGMYRGEPPASFYSKEFPLNQMDGEEASLVSDTVSAIAQQLYAHLVGVVGASSTGLPEAPVTETNTIERSGWMSVDDEGAFIPMSETEYCPKKEGYMFGKHDSM